MARTNYSYEKRQKEIAKKKKKDEKKEEKLARKQEKPTDPADGTVTDTPVVVED